MTTPATVSAEALAGVRLLAGLDAADRERIARRCRGRRVAETASVIENGDDSEDVYCIVSGRVRATIFSRGGREVTFRDLGAGDLFGDLSAIDGRPRSATVVALEASYLLMIPGAVFREVLQTDPGVAFRMLRELTSLVRDLSERVVEFSTLGVNNRIHAELLRLARTSSADGVKARISPAPTHAEIANRISTHREAVSRELRALALAGLVRKQGGALWVEDMPRLEQMVQNVKDG